MIKPRSIARFEQFYWASVLLGLVNAALNWPASRALLAANPMFANAPWLLPLIQVVSLAIAVLIWFFIVRRPSVVAKWVQVVFAAIGVLGLLSGVFLIVTGRGQFGTQAIVGMIANLLYIAAAAMLFKPDARTWLGEGYDEDDLDDPRA